METQHSLQELVTYTELHLSKEAQALRDMEFAVPVEVNKDSSLRLKVLDQCGMACTFCHNEGTPVSSDNIGKSPSEFTANGNSNRVSIYLERNGADFVSGTVQPDRSLHDAMAQVRSSVFFNEVHLTGGEPTLHPKIVDVVAQLTAQGDKVKITSNGERFYAVAAELKEAGLDKVVFSIFGTTPQELAAIQGDKFKNEKFATMKLRALEKSIQAAHEHGIQANANIVLPNLDHADRIVRVIRQFGDICKIRILNSLDEGNESYEAVYELLASLGAVPIRVNIAAGASGMSVDYRLPDGKEVGFKQIRRSYLPSVCDTCTLKDNGCDEGYYGVRMYVDRQNRYRVGVCIQRMDLTRHIDSFTESAIPAMIARHRDNDYDDIITKLSKEMA